PLVFPYTTLFRSALDVEVVLGERHAPVPEVVGQLRLLGQLVEHVLVVLVVDTGHALGHLGVAANGWQVEQDRLHYCNLLDLFRELGFSDRRRAARTRRPDCRPGRAAAPAPRAAPRVAGRAPRRRAPPGRAPRPTRRRS